MSNDDVAEDDCIGIEEQAANIIVELWAEVERLRAENARLRAQVGEYFAEQETHPVEET